MAGSLRLKKWSQTWRIADHEGCLGTEPDPQIRTPRVAGKGDTQK